MHHIYNTITFEEIYQLIKSLFDTNLANKDFYNAINIIFILNPAYTLMLIMFTLALYSAYYAYYEINYNIYSL